MLTRWVYLTIFVLLTACNETQDNTTSISVSSALGEGTNQENLSGYARAIDPHYFSFPKDYNAHPEYKNEWWYFTGNLETSDGRPFGYQVTFFRIGLSSENNQRSSSWATNNIWMAHVAITDIDGKKHFKMERFARGAAGLAGNTEKPFRVWLENWQLSAKETDFPWQINIEEEAFSIKLDVNPHKKVVLQGDNGLSQKSPAIGNASYYFSYTRLNTAGELTIGENTYSVKGLSWFDREWGTSLLGEDQTGWDWFSLQFDSGDDLMFYQLRDNQGKPHPSSLGSWVNPDSQSQTIKPQDIRLKPLKWWRSSDGTNYPISWELHYLPANKHWHIKAAIPEQHMDVTVKYWEGAVKVFDSETNDLVGKGYLEMTGY